MDRERIRYFIIKAFRYYLVYVLIFAVLIFAFHKPREKINISLDQGPVSNRLNRDRVVLVESGEEAALTRLNLIENAEESIDISYYTFTDGISTKIILAGILDAADRGVDVRILLDGIFNNLRGELRNTIYGFELHPNIELKFYQPLRLISPLSWNNRLHDKIIIVDESLALIGGRNIGDRYFREEKMKDAFVKDRDVLILKNQDHSSSVIGDMRDYYEKIWNHEYSKASIKKLSSRQRDKGRDFNQSLKSGYIDFKRIYIEDYKYIDWKKKAIAADDIKFVYNPIGKTNQDPWCLREILKLSSQAKESIFIQSPYIIPSRSMIQNFNEYPIDYEKISILTNSLASSPNPLAVSGYINKKEAIIDSGADIYEYQGPDSIHSKTYIIDRYKSVIGSFNFDARSSYINTESMVVISSKEFAHKLKEEIEKDIGKSLKVGKDYKYIENPSVEEGEISIFIKILSEFLSKLVRFLEYLL